MTLWGAPPHGETTHDRPRTVQHRRQRRADLATQRGETPTEPHRHSGAATQREQLGDPDAFDATMATHDIMVALHPHATHRHSRARRSRVRTHPGSAHHTTNNHHHGINHNDHDHDHDHR